MQEGCLGQLIIRMVSGNQVIKNIIEIRGVLMEQSTRTAFVSYSWDSEQHKQWVMDFVNKLRGNGVDATIDRHLTQSSTINLNQMMITNLQKNDFIIIVLTEKYAEKADSFQGGVGFETILSLPLLQEDPDKIIFITKHQGEFQKVIPFHLRGYYAIDFSDESTFNEAFDELLHRIYGELLYEIEPLGKAPILKPRQSTQQPKSTFSDMEIPNLKRFTDKDIEEFMNQSYKDIVQLLSELFVQIKSSNPNFEFQENRMDNTKTVFNLYVDGDYKTGIKLWLGGMFRQNTIHLSYGRHMTFSNNNSYNEAISHEFDKKNKITLKMTMNIMGNNDANSPELIVKEIWKNQISLHLK